MKSKKQLYQEFQQLDNDVSRWRWFIENKDEPSIPAIELDNDAILVFMDIDGESMDMDFDHYIGRDEGVYHLLEAIGVKTA